MSTEHTAAGAHEPPQRPVRLTRYKPRGRLVHTTTSPGQGDPTAADPVYVAWLVDQSMLRDATELARQFSGTGSKWRNPYALPDPRSAINAASTWFSAYPASLIGRPGRSFLATLGDPELWTAFERIGITAVHTGPVKSSGGLTGWAQTPSTDGSFDRISTRIDPVFGSAEEFRAMVDTAAEHGATVIDDVVPGHTGKGADFRLATMRYGDYPGIYHMVEIAPEHWDLLPPIPDGQDSENIDTETEAELEALGYIVGQMQRVIFAAPGIKETNWSATGPVLGVDGVQRRWVYLHYFKEGQPSLNWLDPTFGAARLVVGDALHSLGDLGAGGLRLDANGFLGLEKTSPGNPAWSENHPLSEAANHMIAASVRSMGGFTFQELNLTINDIKANSLRGADLSYDFVNRPAYHHALATGDTEFLRLTLNASLRIGVQPVQLVHALQNHDELTYELVHFESGHRHDRFVFRGRDLSGEQLAAEIRADLVKHLTGDAGPYNALFTTNGIASTTATVVTASLGIVDLKRMTQEQLADVVSAHLLLAMFNAWQPGVFCLSGWDLVGALTLPREAVAELLEDGDTRWIHRSAYDLMGFDPDVATSSAGLPKGRSLYGTLPEQLEDDRSFASRLADVLHVRADNGLATGEQLDVPAVDHPGVLVMVHTLEGTPDRQMTVLNFGREDVVTTVTSASLFEGARVIDMTTGETVGRVDAERSVAVPLGRLTGRSLRLIVADPA
ncbi:MAG: maltose alpha-D-glucosyltransferase [Candidatus Nanopelagicales bacterium]